MSKGFVRQTLLAFLRDCRGGALYALLCTGVFALLCALFGLPVVGALYAAALCLFAGLVVAGFRFSRYLRLHAELSRLERSARLDAGALPTPSGLIARDYDALLKTQLRQSERAEADAARAKRAQSDYYALWAHQIKVPISAMRLVLQSQPGESAPVLEGELFRIEQYVEMALGYVRLSSSSTDYVLRRCPLNDVIRQAARRFAPLFIRKKLALEYRETALTVLTDEKWLVFALEQLLSNAVKYTRQGHVRIQVDEARETLAVEDTGIGIAPEDLPRVFEQGYTGCNGRGDKRATGLGLYLCKQALTRLGHTVSITSEIGRGTRVEIGLHQEETRAE